ncbi:hypothetical protein EJD97_019719 [Solanum chilense]|uniref:RING-type E3 ubiquitin transferase n=1 Tax=Solanum chilense TaxID=4083 RepID=A0A6N2B0V9_SOLCI|nr:hypothetical protein EJD97_019719 [Solanum chilense]
MALDRDHELEDGVTVEEEFGSSCQTSPQDKRQVVRELIGVIHTVGSYEEYRRSQREECHILSERLKLLLPLFEDIRDFEGQIPELAIECSMRLKKAFSSAKKLLKTCHCGSKIYLAIESEAVMRRFCSVYERLSQALENIPYDDFGISDEEKEQVELVRGQFRRFLCPITLETMTDPVTVSTGQTYERENIQHLLDSGCQTCPKTGEILEHLSLAPNFALKNLIQQWCEKNNFQLPRKQESPKPESHSDEIDEQVLSLIQDLSSSHLEVQRKAVKEIRMLSKENPENRILIVNRGGIPPLVHLLSYPDSRIQEHAVTALLNLSIDGTNKNLISKEEPILAIIEILQNGNVGAKENSAAALFSLSMLDENKEAIGSLNGIPPLIELLKNGTIRGKKDAITALFNLCLNEQNVRLANEAGIVASLFQLLEKKNSEMVDEALSLLLLLATHQDGRQEMGKLTFIETLVNLMRDGTPKNKECSVAVLHRLSIHNSNHMLAALQYGVYEYLVEIGESGTDRGQRKAKSILQHMSKTEQIPCL